MSFKESSVHSETVSIIIPVYNAERHLDKCVESVLRQSYREIEVLLVDDGSTDGSGAACDRWAEKDARIRAIHRENGGVSAARNTGLDAATGEYIAFVDSDDYLAADMIRNLTHALKADGADISICNLQHVDEDGNSLERDPVLPIADEVLTGPEAIYRVSDYYHKGWYYLFVWNKLYKKAVFSGIRFPEGKISEEDFVTHRLFMRCEKVACVSAVGYYYVQRAGSILHNESRKLLLNRVEGRLERAKFCHELGLDRSAGLSYWTCAMELPEACKKGPDAAAVRTEIKEAMRGFRHSIHLCKCCTPKETLQILFVYLSPALYRALFRNSFKRRVKTFARRFCRRVQSEGDT